MEPKFSLTAYVVVMSVTGIAVSVLSNPQFVVWTSVSVWASGLFLWLSYRFRTRSYPKRRMAHRKELDRWVAGQWVGQAVACIGAVALTSFEGWHVEAVPTPVTPLLVGAMLGSAAVFVSALVDWYWVLPKISGITGPLPCVNVADGQFRLVTKLWFAHRAAATAIVTVILAGIPGYLASTSDSGAEGAAWAILGAALSIGYGRVGGDVISAFAYFLSPPVRVARVIKVRPDPRSHQLEDALIIDVSIQGANYKTFAQIEAMAAPEFVEPGTLIKIGELSDVITSSRTAPACVGPADCMGMNWYCFRNPSASTLAGAKSVPAPWGGD
ncbi:hypothetical protein [Nocardioides sp. WS12]|uniref:hypothetical protein n=1 Tax=Nocardioides sp. WS12 TaxID=2486272 RepID=UPI0015FCB420|nr:hypothetical protein [Nocardioides sp. WS12]